MPTLLLINVALNSGSTGKIVEGIGRLALSQGWDVYIAHGARYKNHSELKAIQITSRVGEAIHYLESSLFDAQGLGSRHATRRFLRILDTIQPDIVHIHNIHGCFLNYPLLFSHLRKNNIPVVWTLHDCWAVTGHCAYFEKAKCDKWKTKCHSCPQRREFPTSFLIDRSYRNFLLKKSIFTSLEKLKITSVSSWLKGVVSKSFLGKYPISVIPNGIDVNLFKPTQADFKERLGIVGKKILLAVATGFGERKGIYDYAELAELLHDDYRLVLIGADEDDKKVLPSNVITIRRASGAEELVSFYSAADVLLSLSYEETFGMTIVESMACGTPAIVYNNTAQPELITPETGRVVPTGNISLLKDTIIAMCSIRKSEFSSACRKRAEQFDERMTYKKYLDIYAEMLSE